MLIIYSGFPLKFNIACLKIKGNCFSIALFCCVPPGLQVFGIVTVLNSNAWRFLIRRDLVVISIAHFHFI